MHDKLVAENVEVYPLITAPAFRKSQSLSIELPRFVDVANLHGHVKWGQRHNMKSFLLALIRRWFLVEMITPNGKALAEIEFMRLVSLCTRVEMQVGTVVIQRQLAVYFSTEQPVSSPP